MIVKRWPDDPCFISYLFNCNFSTGRLTAISFKLFASSWSISVLPCIAISSVILIRQIPWSQSTLFLSPSHQSHRLPGFLNVPLPHNFLTWLLHAQWYNNRKWEVFLCHLQMIPYFGQSRTFHFKFHLSHHGHLHFPQTLYQQSLCAVCNPSLHALL